MKRKNRRVEKNFFAFTLMEILVVLAILGLGLAAVTSLTTATSRQAERVEEDTAVQTTCQNMMNSILAGDATVSIGAEIPIPDAPNWAASVELLDGPIPNVVAIRMTAQRFATIETPSTSNPYSTVVSREPDPGRRFVLKEWARRGDVRTRTLRRNLDGTVSAVDGTADASAQNDAAPFSDASTAQGAQDASASQELRASLDAFSASSPATTGASASASPALSSTPGASGVPGVSTGRSTGAVPTTAPSATTGAIPTN